MNARELHELADRCFSKRYPLMSLWQETADNFFVERADFTTSRNLGADFGSHLMSSYPLIVRRDLGNAFETMLRPKGKEWFHMGVEDEDSRGDNDAKRWLEWIAGI